MADLVAGGSVDPEEALGDREAVLMVAVPADVVVDQVDQVDQVAAPLVR